MRLLLFTFLLSALSFGQDRNGISYQALIINPNVEQLPGQDNDHSPLTNTDICLQFHIINSSGNYEYSESQSVTTDAYGMVNLVIGTGTPIGAITWDAVAWSAEAKSLKVDLDITGACTSFTELSNQQLTSVPFALYSPASNTPGPKGDPGDPGADGDSAYQVWLDAGNTGTEQDFLDALKGTDGTPGADGDSAYQVWLDAGNTGTKQDFLDSLKGTDGTPGDPGADGDSAYQVWLDAGNTGTEQDFLDALKGTDGTPGVDGDSAYQVWLDAGNTGTEQDFLDALKGTDGTPGADGDSAYQVWLDAGNTGTEQEFLDSLVGPQGPPGDSFATLTQIPYLSTNEISQLSPEPGSIVYNYQSSTLQLFVRSVNNYNVSFPNFNTADASGSIFVANGWTINAHMTFIVDSPVSIRNISLRDSMDGSSSPHPTNTFPSLILDDDNDLFNGHLGGIEGKVLEAGQYVHIVLDGINNSTYNHRFWYYDSPPSSFGIMSNYLTFVSFHNRPFDFFYEIATTSTGWKTIINYNN